MEARTLQELAQALAEGPVGSLTLEEIADWRLCVRCGARWLRPGTECDCAPSPTAPNGGDRGHDTGH